MRVSGMSVAFAFALLAIPTLASAETGGAAAGAAAGGAAGAVVGGPVGAAVGAGVGGAVGGAATGPDRQNVIIEQRSPESTGSVGCSTTTTQRTDSFGDTTTKQKTEC
jgi:phage tail tape-measure protein